MAAMLRSKGAVPLLARLQATLAAASPCVRLGQMHDSQQHRQRNLSCDLQQYHRLHTASSSSSSFSAVDILAPPPQQQLLRLPLQTTARSLKTSAAPLASAATDEDENAPAATKKKSFVERFGHAVAPASMTDRRWMILPAFLTHMCIGCPWGWSTIAAAITNELGVVCSAADDWSLKAASLPLSVVFCFHGLSAATFAKWQLKVGPRISLMAASACFGGGLLLSSLAVSMHSLPLLYLGFGALCGTGIGLAYTPPVQVLMHWFPDRRGLASGITIAGFGSGALFFAPTVEYIMRKVSTLPRFLGSVEDVQPETEHGRWFANIENGVTEVVVSTPNDPCKNAFAFEVPDGVYEIATGTTGASTALAVMGLGYFATMMACALTIKDPHPSYKPPGYVPHPEDSHKSFVPLNQAVNTKQFFLLGATFFCMSSGGIALFSVAKPMMFQTFSSSLPEIVTASFASSYILMLSAGNLGGRLGWALFLDKFGPRTTFNIFTMMSLPLYASVPFAVNRMIENPSVAPLALFAASTVTAISFMGGTYALLPAYEAKLFGTKFVSAIHGRMLLASSAGGLAGPQLLFYLHSKSQNAAINDLLTKVDPVAFEQAFKEPLANAQELVEAKSVTISRLMPLMPEGVPDPTPYLYNSTMLALSGVMAAATIAHHFVRPLPRSRFVEDDGSSAAAAAAKH
eukprot:m.290554 g.290554  ORF g.290554 m.290554 type:complete len:686 (+) comp12317_c0_seq1:1432-3489(+)